MTYQSKVLATSGLLALWMLNEAAGATSAVDLGPNNLPLSYNAAKADGIELISGAGPGFLATANYASRSVSAGSTLAPVAAITMCGWFQRTSGTITSILCGRNNHFRLASHTSGQMGAYAWNGAVYDLRCSTFGALGKPYFLAATYDGVVYRLYINGALIQEQFFTSNLPLAAVADAFMAGNTGSQLDGTISGVAVFNRVLHGGEIYDLYIEGTKVTPATLQLNMNYVYDKKLPAQALVATPGVRCPVCHGERRTSEPKVIRGSVFYHPGCYAARGDTKSQLAPSASTAWKDYEGPILRLIHYMLQQQTERVADVTKPTYFDASRMQTTTGSTLTTAYDIYGPWSLSAAVLANHVKLPKENWIVTLAISQVERIWQLTDPVTGLIVEPNGSSGGNDFVIASLCEAVLYLKPYISSATYSRWLTNLLKVGNYMIGNYPGGVRATSESTWYTNGNREIWELLGYWMLWLVTKDNKWKTEYESQLKFAANPGTPNGGWTADPTGNRTYGFVTVVEGSAPDGSDGKGYFIERNSSRVSSLTSVDSGGAVLNGYDPNYMAFTCHALSRLWTYNRDPRIFRYMNMIHNLVAERANMTSATVGDVGSWILDGRGGSRQNNLSTFGSSHVASLYVGGRSDITPTLLAGAFNEVFRFNVKDLVNQAHLARDLGLNVATWLLLLPNAPLPKF